MVIHIQFEYLDQLKILVLAADVGTWPLPIKRNDQLIVDGVTLSIEKVLRKYYKVLSYPISHSQ